METFQVRIEKMALEGQAIGKAPGSDKVIFVPYAVPGDLLEVRLIKAKTQYAQAKIMRVIEAGPGRVAPPCPHHFQVSGAEPFWCGGCNMQQLDYAHQLKLKREAVLDALRRIGKFPSVPVAETLPSPPWRCRNKVQVPFAFSGGEIQAGFFAPGTHKIVPFQDCLLQPEFSVRLVHQVAALARRFGWQIYDEDRRRGWLRHLVVRTNQDGQALATLVTRTPEFPRLKEAVAELTRAFPEMIGLHQNVQPAQTSVILGSRWRRLWGRDFIVEKIGGLRLEVSPGAFLQVNTPACEALYRSVEGMLFEGGFRPGHVLDLYCGVGAIALWVAGRAGGAAVMGVEENHRSVDSARHNARLNGAGQVQFFCAKVEDFLKRPANTSAKASEAGVLLDPPRSGLSPLALERLARRGFSRIIYISCDPASFARDARRLADRGYALKAVQPVDLFPQTAHVELAARLDRLR